MPIDPDDDEFGERRRVAHSQARANARDIDRQNAAIFALSDRNGRKLIWDWLAHCGVFGASFDRDPGKMAFNEGRRDVGLWILAQIEAEHPGTYAVMQREHHEREMRYAAIPEPRMEDEDE